MFHAKEIWSGYREPDNTWSRAERVALIVAVASLPRMLGMAVSIGRVRRDWQFPLNTKLMKLHDFHHVVAFNRCVARANKYIRDWAHPDEIATVVAEDVPDKRRFLKKSLKTGHVNLPMTVEFVIPTKAEINAGEITQTNAGPIDRVIDTAHFVEKSDAPLLQIADACAFSFRRYFANQDGGDVLVRAILVSDLVWSDWQEPMSESTFSFNPAHRY